MLILMSFQQKIPWISPEDLILCVNFMKKLWSLIDKFRIGEIQYTVSLHHFQTFFEEIERAEKRRWI